MKHLAWVGLIATGCVLAAAPAGASTPIGLSPDGVHWGSQLAHPLFDPTFRWVPGDSETASFYVRNQATSGASLRVDVRDVRGNTDLGNTLSFSARVPGGDWVELQRQGSSQVLNPSALGTGEALRVDLRAVFVRTATNRTQDEAVAMRIGVTLSDSRAAVAPPRTEQSVRLLAPTGSGVQPWMPWIAAIFAGVGLALVLGARRQEVNGDG